MSNSDVIKYVISGVSIGLSAWILAVTSRLDIPECANDRVLASVVTLWKLSALRSEQPIQDGRLKEPFEVPLRIANGRACTAEILVDGQTNGSIAYTVMRPLKGAANMASLD